MKKFRIILFLTVLVLSVSWFSCSKQVEPPLNPANMDLSVKPGDDFFQYANGTWIRNNPIPDEYSRYGAFEQLTEQNYKDLVKLLTDAAEDETAEEGSIKQKIGDFYKTGMDTVQIEELGITPLNADLERINNILTIVDVQREVAIMQTYGIFPLFRIFAYPDEKNSKMMIVQLSQGGLGLPDRDYYLDKDKRSTELREEYVKHIAMMLKLAGDPADEALKAADKIMALETRLAKASMTRLERRDPHATYNKMSLKKLSRLSRYYGWGTYFSLIGLPEPGDINVRQPDFFKEISRMMKDVTIGDWKLYLKWNLINRSADYLSSDFVNQDFHFYGNVLSGRKSIQPRWKRVLRSENRALGEAVGQLYVEKYFPPAAKERMLDLVANLKSALGERIKKLDWMGEATKEQALKKLKVMNVKIGYPDKWIDYTNCQIKDDSYIQNMRRANQFDFHRNMDKTGKPVDPDEWQMNPQTVNAYYSPTRNEIVFPAAILQPPFFNMAADDAVNYGAIGMVIGHEMTHGFDDQGRNYDADGNLRDWWTKDDEEKFKARSQVLVDQYDNFTVLDSLHVNGKLTLGENIADLGGLNVAYDALQKSMEGKPRPALIDGFTPEQRFFLSLAQVWRQNIRDKELMRRLREDVHSPGQFRVNGPMANMAQFYAAFNIGDDNNMYIPEDKRAKIW